ncbi:hypothetical protein LguiB_035343 [Lonicera macranthoides]
MIMTAKEVIGEGGDMGSEKDEASAKEVTEKGKEWVPSLEKSIEPIRIKSVLILC